MSCVSIVSSKISVDLIDKYDNNLFTNINN